jgi:anti-sigma factor RsiW
MRDNHIITMLEEKAVGRLSGDEIAAIEAHTADCPKCMLAYKAARASDSLIRARASETIDVSPFFKTRVMASIKERQLSPEMPALLRMWKAAGAIVSMMAAMVVILIGLNIFSYGPDSQTQSTEIASSQNIFSPEYVVLEGGDVAGDSVAYDQVLGTIYDSEDEDGN